MGKRLDLQTLLETIPGAKKVYFQPPENLVIEYPCIVYMRDNVDTKFANNSPYRRTKRYQVTVIDRNPDSEIPDEVGGLPLCRFSRHFVNDNLHHDVFFLYF